LAFDRGVSAFWNIPRISLLLIFLFTLDRIIYIIFIATDVLYARGIVSILFAEIPSLFFFTIISLLTFSWAEISYTKVVDKAKIKKKWYRYHQTPTYPHSTQSIHLFSNSNHKSYILLY